MKKITIILGIVFLQISLFAQIPTTGLVGYWPFNGNAIDESGNGNNGTVYGATLTEDRFGNPNSAYSFDGIDDYIEIYNTLIHNSDSAFSINIWANKTGSKGVIISDRTQNNYAYKYTINSGNGGNEKIITIHDGSTNYISAAFEYATNDWLMYTATYNHNSGELKLYLNGIIKDTTIGQIWNTLESPTIIGNILGNDNQIFTGLIDDIRIYNRVLNSTEISSLYNEGLCYETITVTDTLIINANLTNYNPITFNNTIKIYPNPTSDHIFIDVDNNSMGYELKIINTLSQTVFQTTLNQSQYYIDLNTWTGNGTYFVQFYNTNGNLIDVKKIIIQ